MQEGTKNALKTAAMLGAIEVGYHALEERQAQAYGYSRGFWDQTWAMWVFFMIIAAVVVCGFILLDGDANYQGMSYACTQATGDDAFCGTVFPID